MAALRDELTDVAVRVDQLLPDLKNEITFGPKGEPVLKRVQAREIPASAIGLDPVEQQKRLRYNDLVAACVILQNTVDMMNGLEDLTKEGQGIDMADVRYLSPYATGHVKRFGDYALDLGKPPESWL